ncbi:gp53-like domain-containing protein [Leptotrichia trevisanii]
MAVFKDTTITDNGRTLIADALANNKQITFTRMITSSKSYEDSTDVSKLISVDEIKQSVNMTRINQEGTKVRLNAIFTNSAVNTSYKIQTIGLYAKIGTGNEILYSVTRAKEPDTMPATNGINLATVEIDLITEINNSNGATMLMNPSSLVTTSSLIMELEKITGLEFGGNIQDTGNKVKGKFYFDNVTKFYYECIADTNLTYNESSKFRAISNKPVSDRLENLFSSENTYFRIGTMIIQCGRNEVPENSNENGATFKFPKPFPNSCFAITANDVGGGARSVAVSPASTSEFKAWARFGKDFSGSIFYWIAIGF